MNLFFKHKAVRLLLVFSVSIWMAGGCLFGCSNSMMAAGVMNDSVPIVEAGESCHAAQSHHCCTTKKAKKQVVRNAQQSVGLPAFLPAPHDLMRDCPLVVNATAATSKNSTHVPDAPRVPVAVLPSFEKESTDAAADSVVSFLPNRGPTQLRCCVFLI